jgi:hypothetical protein
MGYCPPRPRRIYEVKIWVVGKQFDHIQGGIDASSGSADVEARGRFAFVRYALFYPADTWTGYQYLGTPVFCPKKELLAIHLRLISHC